MSDINGQGHGDKHNWEHKGTEQMQLPQYRSTLYVCRDCKIHFRHWYNVTPDIFEDMLQRGIPDECHKDKHV
jgi:hypothetical protein